MTDSLVEALRTGGSAGPGIATGVAVAINNSGQQLVAAQTDRRHVVLRGAIVASGGAATVTVRSGGVGGTLLATIPLQDGVPMPLTIFGLFSAAGEDLYIATATAVAVTGRVVTQST